MANAVLKTTRIALLVCIIRCGEKRSTSDPPMSMKKTVGMLLTAMIVPTASGSPVMSKTSQGKVIRSN